MARKTKREIENEKIEVARIERMADADAPAPREGRNERQAHARLPLFPTIGLLIGQK